MAHSSRHLARRSAVQGLYQWHMTGQPKTDIEETFIHNDSLKGKHREYFQQLLGGVQKHIEQLDKVISPHVNRNQDLVDPIEHAIIRVSCYELFYEADVPTNVIIDEAIDIAKVFSSENGYKFVNGVIDKLAKEIRSFEG